MSHSVTSMKRSPQGIFNQPSTVFQFLIFHVACSRVSQYVFVPTKESYFSILDQYADTLEGDVKKPLVLVGNEGSGKSALLANWVAKRREHKHRDEFLFQHFVGCSSQSLQVRLFVLMFPGAYVNSFVLNKKLAHTLSRLESALASFFHFNRMKVPDTEVELRWSLNRFLEAASKKHSPARIVIIIDGVHNLKSEGSPDGVLYWLPTELPKCVRFIISTVENDRVPRGKRENAPHHTFVELVRRQCQIERILPLSVTTCHSVINAFRNLHTHSFELAEAQQFKIVTANSSTQPMYLRSVLQAIRLATALTGVSAEELVERFLSCASAHELVHQSLAICCQVNDRDEDEEQILQDLLGKMMSMVYASRSGLTEVEIWGILRMVAGSEPTSDQKERLLTILKDFTMVVNDMYAFSHEVYREVVFAKYIHNRGALVRWHHYLSRFFDQLPTCPRKLVALPYHLEMAGSWSKVKNCLTDIEMFELWRTPEFRADFMKFWASLIQKSPSSNNGSGMKGHGGANDAYETASTHTNTANGTVSSGGGVGGSGGMASNRPSYDIVDEYCKSLDEYRNAKNPSDAKVRDIILQIANFLLDFAMLGHEKDADPPALVHPKIPYEDLESMGVPYIQIDDSGASVQRAPKRSFMVLEDGTAGANNANNGTGTTNTTGDNGLGNTNSNNNALSSTSALNATGGGDNMFGGGSGGDDDAFGDALGTKTMEDETVTIYYFQRWMWIQFPYVALGNCDPQLFEKLHHHHGDKGGTRSSQSFDHADRDGMNNGSTSGSSHHHKFLSQSSSADEIAKMVKRALMKSPVNLSASASDLKLPAIHREMDRERRLKDMKKKGHRAKRTIPRIPPPPPPKARVRGSGGGSGGGLGSSGTGAMLYGSGNGGVGGNNADGSGGNGAEDLALGDGGNGNGLGSGNGVGLDGSNEGDDAGNAANSSGNGIAGENNTSGKGNNAGGNTLASGNAPNSTLNGNTNGSAATGNQMSVSASFEATGGSYNGKPQLTQLQIRTMALQDSIQIAREEFDQLVQDRALVERKLQGLKDTLVDLKRTAESCTIYDDELKQAMERSMEAQIKLEKALHWNHNLKNLATMCDRHPANVPALITELQEKIELDEVLLTEIRKRLWEQRFEQQTYFSTFRHMRTLVSDACSMRDNIIALKEKLRDDLVLQAEEDERKILRSSSSRQKSPTNLDNNSSSVVAGNNTNGEKNTGAPLKSAVHFLAGVTGKSAGHTLLSPQDELLALLQHNDHTNNSNGNVNGEGLATSPELTAQGIGSYFEAWEMMSTSTGITDPVAFSQRMQNA